MSSSTDPSHQHSNGNNGFDAQPDSDGSEGSASDHGDDTSSVVELEPEDFPSYFSERDGRLFHAGSSPYPLPVDAPEQENAAFQRLALEHNLLRRFLQANYVGPVAELFSDPGRNMALDLCTGKGTWVMDMAQEFPQVRFRAFDIVPIATRYPLENVQFEVDDVNNHFRWNNATFDLVHARIIAMAVRDYSQVLQEVVRVLRPGGLFLSLEWSPYPTLDPSIQQDPATYAPASTRFHDAINQALLHRRGLRPIAGQVHTLLADAGVFQEISSTPYHIPIGAWSTDPFLRDIGATCRDINEIYTSSVKPLLIDSGWTEGQLNRLFADFIREIRSLNGLVSVLYVVHARKAQT